MNEISLNIDITKPSLQNKINKQTRQNKISGLIQVDPRILNPASDLSHKEIWKELENELKAGEKSGMISNFDRTKSLTKLHKKYSENEIWDKGKFGNPESI